MVKFCDFCLCGGIFVFYILNVIFYISNYIIVKVVIGFGVYDIGIVIEVDVWN